MASLLPPNATALERHLEAVTAPRFDDMPVPLRELWDPETCPLALLPYLAWALSIDVWDPDWTEAAKREQVAIALQLQRRKGTVQSVRSLLEAYEAGLILTEWFQLDPPGAPYTFDVTLPLDESGGPFSTAEFIEKIATRIVITKPVRAHFTLTQRLEAGATMGMIGGALPALFDRRAFDMEVDDGAEWDDVLCTEHGEPFALEEGGGFVEADL